MKKIIAFLVLLSVLCLPVCAVEYSTEYPIYVPISGGAYIEVQSSLGRGTLIFPNQYQNDTFGFSGSGLNLCNITYSTVSGYFYPSSGKPVQVRFQRYATLEYYRESSSSWNGEWLPVTTSAIYNTNVRFIDNTSLTRAQEGPVFDDGQRTMIPLLIALLLAIIGICLGFRRK